VSTSPANNAAGIAANTTITANFSEAMQAGSLSGALTIARSAGGANVQGTVSTTGDSVTLTPFSPLQAGTQYTAIVSTAAKDLAGNPLALAHSWAFSTSVEALSMTIFPDSLTLPLGIHFTVQLPMSAQEYMSDTTTQDVTESVVWSTSDAAIVDVSNAPGLHGVIGTFSVGDVTISAVDAASNLTAAVTVNVNANEVAYINDVLDLNANDGVWSARTATDASGDVLVVWSQFDQPQKFFSLRFDSQSGWGNVAPVDFPFLIPLNLADMVMNDSGEALLVSSDPQGIYTTRFVPGTGWEAQAVVQSGTSPFLAFGNVNYFNIDSAGDGLLVWNQALGGDTYNSRYTRSVGWSAPQKLHQQVGGGGSSSYGTAAGNAVVLSMRDPCGNSLSGDLFCLDRFSKANGWQLDEVLPFMTTSPLAVGKFAVATNDNGGAMVIWQAGGAAASPFYAARYTVSGGWEPPAVLDTRLVMGSPTISMDASGNAVVVYSLLYTGVSGAIAATTYQAGFGWSSPVTLKTYLAGGVTQLNLRSDAQGRAIATWQTPSYQVQVARHDSVNGWIVPPPTWGGIGNVSFPMLSVGSSGKAVAVWTELFDGPLIGGISKIGNGLMVGRWIGF